MSPTGPTFSSVPPPAKRHQSGPPGQMDGRQTPQPNAVPPPPPPQANPPAAPSYSFYQANKPYTVPYHPGPAYSTAPPGPPQTQPGLGLPLPISQDRSPYTVNGRPASPLPRPHPLAGALPSQSTPPSRQPSSAYDTRPPPSTSGFASINAPATSGFASINPRAAATPPAAHTGLAKSAEIDGNRPSTGGPPNDSSFNNPSAYRYNNGSPASNTAASTPATGSKRTPSTTHPYQMSEAFANRHHHCERVDGLNRGIWTSYGPAGTQEHPTGPAVEMYLRCNHENCRRIDWRTVHGLQCHIVKNHEQPKGTIGSLEKALDRYGVPVKEVEDYERDHGEGTGGTMADPKNLKIKNKTRDALNRKSTPASYGIDPSARPAGYKPSPPGLRDSPTFAGAGPRHSSGSMIRRAYGQEESHSDTDESGSVQGEFRKSGPPPSRYEGLRNDWNSRPSPASTLGRPPMDANRQLQGDAVMRDVPPVSAPPVSTAAWKHWSPINPTPEATASSRTISVPEPSHTISNESVPRPSGPESTAPPPTFQSGIPSTQTQAMAQQVAKIEENKEKADITFATPNPTATQNTDTQMSGVSETQPAVSHVPSPVVDGRKDTSRDRQTSTNAGAGVNQPSRSDIMDLDDNTHTQPAISTSTSKPQVDGTPTTTPQDAPTVSATASGGPASGTRSLHSPVITTKPLPAPGSAKRISRRSSTVRKGDGDGDTVSATPVDGDVAKEKDRGGDRIGDRDGGKQVDDDGVANRAKDEDASKDNDGDLNRERAGDADADADADRAVKYAQKNKPNDQEKDGQKEKEKDEDEDRDKDSSDDMIILNTSRRESKDSLGMSMRQREREREREKEREREREAEKETRTPPRRNANGRFVRKKTLERGY